MPIRIAGEDCTTCPRRVIYDNPAEFSEILRLYSLYDKGVLLRDGGVDDQPNMYLEYMACIQGAVGEIQEYYTEQAAQGKSPRDLKKKGRKGG